MAFKIFLVCASALLVQVYSQCLAGPGLAGAGLAGGWAGPGAWAGGLGGAGCGCGGVASTGGGLPVASASPIPPVGVSVLSENAYEGGLCVGGNLPFLGTVGLEGILPTAGAGSVSYGCGNGNIGIAEEGSIVTGITSPGSYGPGIGAIGGLGAGGLGLGLGGINGPCYGAGLGGINGYGLGGYGLGSCGCGGAIY